MFDYKNMKMSKFEGYSFTRLIRTQSLEFYFIRGVNEPQNFDGNWDGRLIEVLGYLVTYIDVKKGQQKSFVYLIEDETKNFQEIIKHIKKFVSEIYMFTELFDMTNFLIQSTNVYQKVLSEHEIVNFIKKIVNDDIPEYIFDEIKQ